jgi:Domain of unknown function (DUF397)
VNEQGLSSRAWRKSSYSGGDGACIEVAGNLPAFIAVRDSKNAEGPELTFALTEWVRFMSQLKGS